MVLSKSFRSHLNIVNASEKSRKRVAHDGEMLKLWRLVKRGGVLEMDRSWWTEAEGKPGEGPVSPEERPSGWRLLLRGQDIHLADRHKKGSWDVTVGN